MRKHSLLLGVVLALVLALVAAGCGDGDEEAAPPGEETEAVVEEPAETETEAVETEPEAAAPEFSTLEEGVLTVGSDIPFPPFEFREGGELTGFDIELVREIASRLGIEDIEFVDTAFDTIFTQLAGGRFDIVASATTITPERDEIVDFSDPYYLAQQALTVNTEQTPDLQSVEDLADGDTVAVQTGTTGETWAQENLPEGVEIRSFPEAPDTYTALEAGQVAAVIFDEPSALTEADTRPNLEVVATIDTGEEYGFPVNPENTELLDAVNQALQEIKDDGTYGEIYAQFEELPPGGNVVEARS